MEADLQLKELELHSGTSAYHNIMGIDVTDGVIYTMKNGYSWFITDAISILRLKLKGQEFVSVKLKVNNEEAVVIYDDGNGNVLHKQEYKYTDAKKDVTLFYTNDVLMLSNEY